MSVQIVRAAANSVSPNAFMKFPSLDILQQSCVWQILCYCANTIPSANHKVNSIFFFFFEMVIGGWLPHFYSAK